MTLVHRVLPASPVASLAEYGDGEALRVARAVEPEAVIGEVEASGLRGRGGAGFPTGRSGGRSRATGPTMVAATVVVNAAEGEPGTFKDRAILRRQPVRRARGRAHRGPCRRRRRGRRRAEADVRGRGRPGCAPPSTRSRPRGLDRTASQIDVFEGPAEYLYGEETALLEVLDGRPPFPRIAPPYRRGAVEVVETRRRRREQRAGRGRRDGGTGRRQPRPPTLVNNVETLANVPAHRGPRRRVVPRGRHRRVAGHDRVHGQRPACATPGVGEVAMGTTAARGRSTTIGGGARPAARVVAVLSGVANALDAGRGLDTPLTLRGHGRGRQRARLGGFIVFDDDDRPRGRRRRRVAVPRRRVVRPVHAVQAGRPGAGGAARPGWPRSDADADVEPPSPNAACDRGRRGPLQPRPAAAGRRSERCSTLPRGRARPTSTATAEPVEPTRRRRAARHRRRRRVVVDDPPSGQAAGLDLRRGGLGRYARAERLADHL